MGSNQALAKREQAPAGQVDRSELAARQRFSPQTPEDLIRVADIIHSGGLCSKGFKNPQAVFSAIMLGAELGLSPWMALRGIYVVDNKPTLAAQAMVALIRRSSTCAYFECVESTDDKATWECCRKGRKPARETFSIQDAEKAGLKNKSGPWTTYPRQMLVWRAASILARREFAEVILGLYTPEEIRDGSAIDVEVIDSTPTPTALEQPTTAASTPTASSSAPVDDRPILVAVKRELIALVGKERATEVWLREIEPGPPEGLVTRAREWMAAEQRLQKAGPDEDAVCGMCGGSSDIPCPDCGASGVVDCHTPMHEHGRQYDGHPCPKCRGDLKVKCGRCKGRKRAECPGCAPLPESGQAGLQLDKVPEPPPIERPEDRQPGSEG